MDEYLFDDLDSIIHFILGVFTPFAGFLGYLIFFVFIIYEVLEPENPISTIGDVVEYLCGLSLGLMLELTIFTLSHKMLLLI